MKVLNDKERANDLYKNLLEVTDNLPGVDDDSNKVSNEIAKYMNSEVANDSPEVLVNDNEVANEIAKYMNGNK